jgi:7,8-dihydro-6-hydroxymethylpterin-pyrophosphokinase
MATVRAYIGLGANVATREATLTAAVHALAACPGHSGRRLAPVRDGPVEVTDQPDFHNAVVALDVPAGPGGPEAPGPIALAARPQVDRARLR